MEWSGFTSSSMENDGNGQRDQKKLLHAHLIFLYKNIEVKCNASLLKAKDCNL